MPPTPQTLLAEAECYLCTGVSLEEAMELALLAEIASVKPITPPVLSFSFPNLSWTFSGSNPQTWSIQESNDFGATWEQVNTVAGTARGAVFTDSGVLVRIVGVNPAVPASNILSVN